MAVPLGSEGGVYDVQFVAVEDLQLGGPAVGQVYLFPDGFVPPEQVLLPAICFEIEYSYVLFEHRQNIAVSIVLGSPLGHHPIFQAVAVLLLALFLNFDVESAGPVSLDGLF